MKPIIRAIALLLLTAVICTCCNFTAPLIDNETMRRNAWQGALMLGEQDATPQLVGGFKNAQLDNYTAILILKTAAYTGDEPLALRALGGLRADMPPAEGETSWQAYARYESGSNAPEGHIMHYARYWHGYMLPLRLLLSVFDLANLQMLLYFAQSALFAAVLVCLCRRGLTVLAPGIFLSYFLLMPAASGICLQYAPASLLMLLGCIAILTKDEAIARAVTLPGFFALTGLLTNYFDLLTAPLLTLLFPLILLLCLRMKRGESLRALILLAVACCAAWAMGYGCMWALKWLLNCLVYGPSHLENILRQMTLRTSTEETYSRIDAITRNFGVFFAKKSYLVLMLAAGLTAVAPSARALILRRGVRTDFRALSLLVPFTVPLAWYIVMANHSCHHTYFTCRAAVCTMMAAYALAALILTPEDKEDAS